MTGVGTWLALHAAVQVLPPEVLAVLVSFAVAWAAWERAEATMAREAARAVTQRVLACDGWSPRADGEPEIDVDEIAQDLARADDLLARGDVAEARREIARMLDLVAGRDEAAETDARWRAWKYETSRGSGSAHD